MLGNIIRISWEPAADQLQPAWEQEEFAREQEEFAKHSQGRLER